MPRANRSYLPGYVWHITHRCHDREFLLRAQTDRSNWRRWLWEAKSRFGVSVLNFVVTANHIHLLVHDPAGDQSVSRTLQLVEGRTAQAYNRRHRRRGAFWQDRHHAVAVESERYLWNCLVYIDLNMVRAGVVAHPREWPCGGYNEIQHPRSRYRVLDLERLADLTGCSTIGTLQTSHRDRVEAALANGDLARDSRWTEAIAVGDEPFVEAIRLRLGLSKLQRVESETGNGAVIRDAHGNYAPKTPTLFSG